MENRDEKPAASKPVKRREYQARAVTQIRAQWAEGKRVCAAGPTGCGKTRIGFESVSSEERVLFVVHRRDLRRQSQSALKREFRRQTGETSERVAVLMPGRRRVRDAQVIVASVQTLLEQPAIEALGGRVFSVVVLDEAHHYMADSWYCVTRWIGPKTKLLGLTAYPQRRDGRSLRHMFDAVVPIASYADLIRDGYLVRCRVYRPDVVLGHDLAEDPVAAWCKYSEGSKTFAFVPRIEAAYQLANDFRRANVRAEVIENETSATARQERMDSFRSPDGVRVLVSVDALTEGTDVPQARCVLLARPFQFEGAYVQAVGRVLRTSAGKRDAICIDLVGASILHGLPTSERSYRLGDEDDDEWEPPELGQTGDGKIDVDTDVEPSPTVFEQNVVNTELRLVDPGALAPGEKPAPTVLEPASLEPLEPVPFAHRIRVPRYHRGTKPLDMMRGSGPAHPTPES